MRQTDRQRQRQTRDRLETESQKGDRGRHETERDRDETNTRQTHRHEADRETDKDRYINETYMTQTERQNGDRHEGADDQEATQKRFQVLSYPTGARTDLIGLLIILHSSADTFETYMKKVQKNTNNTSKMHQQQTA